MKLLTFRVGDGSPRLGMKVGDAILDLEKTSQVLLPSGLRFPADMLSFLEAGDEALSAARQIEGTMTGMSDLDHQLRAEGVLYTEPHIRLMAPILNPRKIVCIGLNYRDHCTEQNIDLPKNPVIFTKFTTAIIGPDDEIVHPALTSQLDYEAELVFVMGKAGRHIPVGEALNYVAGYTIGHDVSARDVQFSDKQWVRGKTFDTFAPMGPYLVTGDEIGNPHDLDIKLYLNGQLLQDSNTRHLVFNVPSLIAFLSKGFTFLPGDVVFTGTPAGVGVFRKPPIFMKPGDRVEVEIARIGRLVNRVVAES